MLKHKARRAFALGVAAAMLTILGAWLTLDFATNTTPVFGEVAPVEVRSIRAFGSGRPHVIPAAAFVADGANPDSYFFPFGGGYMQGDAQNYGCLVAPVYLPDGAIIDTVVASVYDNDDTYNMNVAIRRVDNFNGGANTLATVATNGKLSGIQVLDDTTIEYPKVEDPYYSYYATVCINSSLIRLYSIRIYYYDNFIYLPVIINNS